MDDPNKYEYLDDGGYLFLFDGEKKLIFNLTAFLKC